MPPLHLIRTRFILDFHKSEAQMKKITFKQAVKWAGNSSQLAKKLGITRQAIHDWNGSIPEMRQWQIAVLMAEESDQEAA